MVSLSGRARMHTNRRAARALRLAMPIYEYVAADGTTIELVRPMKDADAPVSDPDGKNRKFKRSLSLFAPQGGTPGAGKGSGHVHSGPMCGCGKRTGSCGGG